MSEETKQELLVVLELLKGCCVKNGLSMALCSSTSEILFFDTDKYLETKKMNGIRVDINSLVK